MKGVTERDPAERSVLTRSHGPCELLGLIDLQLRYGKGAFAYKALGMFEQSAQVSGSLHTEYYLVCLAVPARRSLSQRRTAKRLRECVKSVRNAIRRGIGEWPSSVQS